jgi:hypothetical protein
MSGKEKLKLQIDIYRDLKRQNEHDYYQFCNIEDEWAREREAASKARMTVYEMVADRLQAIMEDLESEKEEDDGK